ncbi:MAG: Maf family protein [Lachnospiraceae bacterium]|nr:Maf family protein [Lachnospiraceae bacterium]
MIRYVLASASPRRLELLKQLGIYFEVSPAHGEEIITKELPEDIVKELSRGKACETADRYADKYKNDITVIIGADTIVYHKNEIMGKPKDKDDAVNMLTKLQNDVHQVYTGVTLVIMEKEKRRSVTFYEKTDVAMYPMTGAQIQAYVATGEPMDKAGAYAIQGKCAIYIKKINGEYNNVVGLPIARLMQELYAQGLA